jgi:anti-sigma-K factor RskA
VLEPPRQVWPAIQARLAIRPAHRVRSGRQVLAWAASLLIAVAGALVYRFETAGGAAVATASIAAEGGSPIWQIEVLGRYESSRKLEIEVRGAAAPPSGRSYELWALPKDGKPVSLGVLPSAPGSTIRPLTPAQRLGLTGADKVAVSIEPEGGSPTGQPTGTIAFVAGLRRAT